ncbi:isochorismatase family protein [Streptosporangium sp. NPDC051022]|uniref:isochorismatase family protein n=1 Tax=Streptosporangium sp. NPDC051022 TaxID=3155752 RepID=UPI00342D87EE
MTPHDRQVRDASGYGQRGGLGTRPAVLVVDVTTNFCGDRDEDVLDSIRRWRNSCGRTAWRALPHIARLLEAARARNIPVLYSRGTEYQPFGVYPGRWLTKNARIAALLHDEEKQRQGNEIMGQIKPEAGEIVIEKSKPSAFFGTHLMSYLTYFGTDTLLVVGATTSGCVRATVLDAFSYNFHVAIVEEGVFDRFESSHEVTLFDLSQKYCDVISADEAGAYMRSLPVREDDRIAPAPQARGA